MPKIDIRIDDHSKEVLAKLKSVVPLALKAVGVEAVTYAQKNCPVDTGALRNSIAWAVIDDTGGHPQEGAGEPSTPKAKPEWNSVYIGSNLEYAPVQEYGDYAHKVGQKHFLRDAAANHSDHYKEILEAALKA